MCLHTVSWLPSTMLSYLTATCLSSDPSSLSPPRRKTCHQLGSGTIWSLMCRALLYFPHLHVLNRWHSTSSFSQLPKVLVILFHSTMRLLLHCFPTGLGTSWFAPTVEPAPRASPSSTPEALEKVRVINAASWKFLAPKAPLCACLLCLADGFICRNAEVQPCSAKGWPSKFHSIYSFELTALPICK